MLKCSGLVIWRLGSRATVRKYSSSGVTVFKSEKLDSTRSISDSDVKGPEENGLERSGKGSGLVAAVFATLNDPESPEDTRKPSVKSVKHSRQQLLDNQIVRATDVNNLLQVAENPIVSRRHALKMVSVLSEWSSSNKIKLTDFEKDPRFLKLCRILARTPTTQALTSMTMAEDLSTVLGITGDDEAARLVTNLTLPQMVKMLKCSGLVIWRLGSRATVRKYSSSGVTVFKSEKLDSTRSISDSDVKGPEENGLERSGKGSGLVAAVFATLNDPESPEDTRKPSVKSVKHSRQQLLDNQIVRATDVNNLLQVAENPIVSRRHALKMVSVLSEWSSSNKIKLTDFEKDPRFLKLCRILARTPTTQALTSMTMAEDLSTVLGITGDDEAARLVTNLTLPQMVKVMKVLHVKGRRSTPLLRALSHNIAKQPETIDLKRSADLLYSMTSLNFPDPVLLDRICKDVIECLPANTDKPSVVSSILVSLGLLKYRHETVLTAISDWTQHHKSICRPNDIAAAVVTFATVNYVPPQSEDLFQVAASLKEEEMVRASSWLDLVFSLLVLNRAEPRNLISTLQPEFIDKLLSSGEIPIPSRRKLMAIDAHLNLTNPTSPRLPEDISVGVPVVYTKEKMLYVQSIMDTFKSLVSAERFLRKDCNSGMGFLYDAEFAVDAKSHPVPLERAASDKSVYRIAVMGLDYHDMTRKTFVPLGTNLLYAKLLELKGYTVLQIPYTEYNPKDKLVTRVRYIEKRLKEIINSKES